MDPSALSDGSDLVGDIDGGDSGANAAGPNDGALNAVSAGVRAANNDKDAQATEAERQLVKRYWKEYEVARDFDKAQRMTYAQDRKYAAGLGDPSWASDANLIGSFIDILTSFLYAQNPDVNAKAAENVGEVVEDYSADFAETM